MSDFKIFFKYIFGTIQIKKIEEDTIIFLPNYKHCFAKWLYRKRIIKKILDILYKSNISKVVLSNTLKKDEELKNAICEQNLSILDGKALFEIMALDCIEYIANKQNKELNNLEIAILANDISNNVIDNIMIFSDNTKSLSIVTNNIEKFRSIEEKIREKYGIIIRIANNKRKSLSKANIIVNIDFPEELINKYNINPNAILININQKVKICAKKFNGININDYILSVPNEVLIKFNQNGIKSDFETKELYESIILKEKNLYSAKNIIKNNKAKIIGLTGNNGRINEKEYINFM